ncbi:hypothetical protein SUDANB105_00680 [Streptomyces sp. enrichment culture]
MRSAMRKRPDGAAYSSGTYVSAPGLPSQELFPEAPAAGQSRLTGRSGR